MEMAIGTVVIIIIGLIVLSSTIYILTKTKKGFSETTESYLGSSNVDLLIDECNRLVDLGSSYEYCCVDKTFKLSSSESRDFSCDEARLEEWSGERINQLNCGGIC